MGHFTKADVESFVTRNASSWGTQNLSVRMDWGYRRLLEVDVVHLLSEVIPPKWGSNIKQYGAKIHSPS